MELLMNEKSASAVKYCVRLLVTRFIDKKDLMNYYYTYAKAHNSQL